MGRVHVAVCAKQVPDPAAEPVLDEASGRLVRGGDPVLDPGDAGGVELALRLVEAAGGEVTVVSMTPPGSLAGVRAALAMGATRAVVVTDDALAGSDSLGTARVLAAAVRWASRKSGAPVDLVVAGAESADGSTGTVPSQMAELMGLPSVTFARRVEVAGGALLAHRETDTGYDEVVCPLPTVITVAPGAVPPRYPTFAAVMGAGSKPLERLSVVDIGVDPALVGAAGAGQEVTGLAPAPRRGGSATVVDDGSAHEVVLRLFEKLGVV